VIYGSLVKSAIESSVFVTFILEHRVHGLAVSITAPAGVVWGMWSVGLYPKLEVSEYFGYKEAWHLLRGEMPGVITRIQACAEEYSPEGA
jgi:hypothetical protein